MSVVCFKFLNVSQCFFCGGGFGGVSNCECIQMTVGPVILRKYLCSGAVSLFADFIDFTYSDFLTCQQSIF